MTDWSTVKTFVGPLRGYRAWRPVFPRGKIQTLAFGGIIGTDVLTAGCSLRNMGLTPFHHPAGLAAPVSECTCGFYAFYEPHHEMCPCLKKPWPWGRGMTIENYWRLRVVGVVDGYGRIFLHEYGFRAEKIRIRGLCHPDERYRVELRKTFPGVEMFADEKDMIDYFPEVPVSR